MNNNAFVSIIIPAFNEEDNIEKCLRSIKDQKNTGIEYEIIVVDNGSTDKTREIAEKLSATVLVMPDVTISALRNSGVRSSRGAVVAFLDSDCLAGDGWLENGLNSFNDPDVAAAGSMYNIPDNASWVAKAWGIQTAEKEDPMFVDYVPSGNLFVRKDRYNEVGGFSEHLRVSEDTDLGYKLRAKGYKVLSNKSISVLHLGEPGSLKKFFQKELWYGEDVFSIFLKSKFKMRNLKVVILALFYVVSIILGAAFLLLSLYKWFFILLLSAAFLPFLISAKTCISKNSLKYFAQLWLLYLTYGLARAVCIIDVRNWINGK
jgi:glycosyltransferase involved in cell wall biosynthesis